MATSRWLQRDKSSAELVINKLTNLCLGNTGISEGLWWAGQMRSHVNQHIWEEGQGGWTWPRFAYRNADYRIIHNLRPTKVLKKAKHRSKGNIGPSEPFTCFTKLQAFQRYTWRDRGRYTVLESLLFSPPLSVHHHAVPDAAG